MAGPELLFDLFGCWVGDQMQRRTEMKKVLSSNHLYIYTLLFRQYITCFAQNLIYWVIGNDSWVYYYYLFLVRSDLWGWPHQVAKCCWIEFIQVWPTLWRSKPFNEYAYLCFMITYVGPSLTTTINAWFGHFWKNALKLHINHSILIKLIT